MAYPTIYQDTKGIDCVVFTNPDGSVSSMLKSAYDAQQAQVTTPPLV